MNRQCSRGLFVLTLVGVSLVHAHAISAQVPQAQATQRTAGAATRVQSVRTFGGPSRFVAPVPTVDALKRSMSRPAIGRDIRRVLDAAGLGSLHAEMVRVLSDGQVTETTLPPGTVIEWMALRRGGRPGILRNARWDGRPAPGYQFTIDNLSETFTFFAPEVCGNISLLRREPSRESARRAEEARLVADNARRQEEARVADARATEARLADAGRVEEARVAAAAAARAVEEARIAEDARRAESARTAGDARVAEEARTAEQARQAEATRRVDEARESRMRPFVAGLVGKQQRQYDDTDPAGIGRMVNPVVPFGDALAGVKGGVAFSMSEHWSFLPAIGVAINLEERSRSTLFGDAEVAYTFPAGVYLGTGVTLWDITRREILTLGWLGTGGVRLWRSDSRAHDLFVAAEWRQLFDRMSDPDVNYQFWGGVKFVFK